MSDLTLEAIKAWKLTWTPYRVTDAGTCLEWQGRADRCRILVDPVAHAYLVQSGKDTDALVAEVERLRAVEMAVKRACTHDAHCEEEGEGACCFRAWRAVVLAAGCAQAVTHEDVELLAALHPQEPSDE